MLCSYVNKAELWLVVQMTDTGQLSRARVAGATRGSGILPDILPDLSPLQNIAAPIRLQNEQISTFGQTGHSSEWNCKARNKEVWLPLFERKRAVDCKSLHCCIGVLLAEKGNVSTLLPSLCIW